MDPLQQNVYRMEHGMSHNHSVVGKSVTNVLHETDIVIYTKEIILPICDKQYHMNKRKVKKGKKIKVLQNCAFYKQD